MRKTSSALLVALLFFAGVAVWFTRSAPPPAMIGQPTGQAARVQHGGFRANDPQTFDGQATMPDAETARRLSPEGWSPPPVFAKTGRPAPQPPFTRGENATRRYAAPETRELPRHLRARVPAMLAMTPADGRTHLLPGEIDFHTRLARRMVFDPASLDRIVAGKASRIIAPTTSDETITLQFHAVKTRSARTHTLLGRVVGEEETSDAIMVWHDGVIHAQIARYATDQHLEYRIMADGHMMVRELDPTTMTAVCGNPDDGPMGDEALDGLMDEAIQIIPQGDGEIVEDTPGWRTIDVVVGYDQGARIADGGYAQIEGRIIASVDRMTLSFANSLIANTELMLLGTMEDPDYVFPGGTSGSMGGSDELGNLNNFSDGVLDAVSGFHTLLGSDLLCFVTTQTDGSAGIAYRPGRASIVARTYMTSNRITFAHELGHNLGCDHSWGDSSQNNTYYHYGWRLDPDGNTATTSDRVRTIMAYDWSWGGGTRIPYFANPSVSYNGARTGAVDGYNVLGDSTADQRYYQGGLGYSNSDPDKFGFDGNSPALGARNADTINTGWSNNSNYGATYASNRATRTNFAITSPSAGAEWLRGDTRPILFTGGDMQDSATIELHKGGVLQFTLATNLNPATGRDFPWNIPEVLIPGDDYMIRVVLNRNGGTLIADSGFFTIASTTPSVVAQSPPAESPVGAPVSHVSLIFSQEMDPATFAIGDDILSFTGPAGSVLDAEISGASWSVSNTVLTVSFTPRSSPGFYRMVLGPEVADVDGKLLDQDLDEIAGEPIDDRCIATFQISGSGSVETIWSDLVGNDGPDSGWLFSGSGSSWQSGTPTGNPSTSHDGAPVIAQNLAGNYNAGENSFAESPVIDCGGHTDVSLSFRGWKGAGRNDTLYIDAWNGSSWVRVFSYTGPNGGASDSAWLEYQVPLTGSGDLNPDFRLRWGLVDVTTGGSGTQTGWQLDAIVLQGTGQPAADPAPWVVGHSPAQTVELPQSSLWIEFSQPMDTGAFGLEDIISFSGPDGGIAATGFQWLDPSVLRIDFPVQFAAGQYTLVLAPAVPDESGLPLDQDFDGIAGEAGEDNYIAEFTIESSVASGPLATGGDVTLVGGHYVHTFHLGGDNFFQVNGGGTLEVDVLVVGGGGGGGSSTSFGTAGAGGGGAGGLVYQTGFEVAGTANVIIGAGGAAAGTGNTPGNNGGNSSFGPLTALGGGGGAGGNMQGLAGGSGGGSRGNASGGAGLQPASASGGFGNPGGGWTAAGGDGAGGGGGAGAPAASAPPSNAKVGGPGGAGQAHDINGIAVHYAGGGGGGGSTTSAFGTGGQGGGGNGANNDNPATPGAPHTGGGGGGGNNNRTGAAGGSGIVIVRYAAASSSPYEAWASGDFANPFLETDPGEDPDGDGLDNRTEFAFGTDPTAGAPGPIVYEPGGNVITPGVPIAHNSATDGEPAFLAVFSRRKDHRDAGLNYAVQFSADLSLWFVSQDEPIVLTDPDGVGGVDAVGVPFPDSIPGDGGGNRPAFFRVGITME
jgi:hypothetical protein